MTTLPGLLLAAMPLMTNSLSTDRSNPAPPPMLALLDRDGVINVDVGAPGVIRPSQLRLTPGAAGAIGRLRRSGCKVALITNQSCIGKGLVSSRGLEEIHGVMRSMLMAEDPDAMLDAIYACESVKESCDPRMKPNPGMIVEACRDFGVKGGDCVMVGDALRDLQASKAGGVECRILVSTGYGLSLMGGKHPTGLAQLVENEENFPNLNDSSVFPFVYVENLAAAVDWIYGKNRKKDFHN